MCSHSMKVEYKFVRRFEFLPSQKRVFRDVQETISKLLSRPAPSGPGFYHGQPQTGRV